LCSSLLFLIAGELRAETIRVYFGTSNGGSPASQGIYLSTLGTETGALSAPARVAVTDSPTFLAFTPDGRRLYATVSVGTGRVRGWNVDGETGALSLINDRPTGSASPTYVKVDATGGTLFAVSYSSAIVNSFPLAADGSIGPAASTITHTGSSVHPRQNVPHPHWISPGPQNRWVYVPDLGIDKVVRYDFDSGDSTLTADGASTVPAGYGPRHMAFHPNHRWVYLVEEIARKLTLLDYDDANGALAPRAHYDADSTTQTTGNDTTSEVTVHPTGRFVYVGNRGQDTIGAFAVDPGDGTLSVIEREPTRGATPRHINVDPTGRWLISANQNGNSLTLFEIDPQTGALDYTGTSLPLGRPMCVMFEPVNQSAASDWRLFSLAGAELERTIDWGTERTHY
jgi:6-phosphogluconolactonase